MSAESVADDMNALRDLCNCFRRDHIKATTLLLCVAAISRPYPEATQVAMRAFIEEMLYAPLAALQPGGTVERKE